MNTLHVAIEVILLFGENSFHMVEQEIQSQFTQIQLFYKKGVHFLKSV